MAPKQQNVKPKVLWIDDDEIVAEFAKRLHAFIEVEHAELLSTGLDRLSKGGIEVILLDLNLPDSRGLESFTRTYSSAPQVPIIVLSAQMRYESTALKMAYQGAHDWILKPTTPDVVVRAIHCAIERKRLMETVAQERQQMAEKLKRANRDLETFGHVIFHDLKEPLRVTSFCLQLLESRYKDKLDEDVKGLIADTVASVRTTQDMIGALLAYFDAGRRPMQAELINCAEVFWRVVGDLKPQIEETKAVVTNSPLPLMMVDPALLNRLLRNVLDNAIKFRSEEPPAVHVWAEQKGVVWQFSIRDNGIGIASDDFERIFCPFIRLHAWNRYSGMGIGLSVCEKIVQRHGGRIWVESERGKGATFHFTIPVLTGKDGEKD